MATSDTILSFSYWRIGVCFQGPRFTTLQIMVASSHDPRRTQLSLSQVHDSPYFFYHQLTLMGVSMLGDQQRLQHPHGHLYLSRSASETQTIFELYILHSLYACSGVPIFDENHVAKLSPPRIHDDHFAASTSLPMGCSLLINVSRAQDQPAPSILKDEYLPTYLPTEYIRR